MIEVSPHQPVLLAEALAALAIKPSGIYIDATFGRGGHSQQILSALGPEGHLYCIDQDPTAIAYGKQKFSGDTRVTMVHASFREMATLVEEWGLQGHIDGILLDLGVSSPQLDEAERGFSFQKAGPLDMRMNPTEGMSAADWVNSASEREMTDVIRTYGEERFAKKIARTIVSVRQETPITDTLALANLVSEVVRTREPGKHPATRTFQAIRLHINQELASLEEALMGSLMCLASEGHLAVISFHSLEDRVVKRFMREHVKGDVPQGLPIRDADIPRTFKWIAKRIQPSKEEITHNPRSRSAILRVVEKI